MNKPHPPLEKSLFIMYHYLHNKCKLAPDGILRTTYQQIAIDLYQNKSKNERVWSYCKLLQQKGKISILQGHGNMPSLFAIGVIDFNTVIIPINKTKRIFPKGVIIQKRTQNNLITVYNYLVEKCSASPNGIFQISYKQLAIELFNDEHRHGRVWEYCDRLRKRGDISILAGKALSGSWFAIGKHEFTSLDVHQ
jgi:hypothetical protein